MLLKMLEIGRKNFRSRRRRSARKSTSDATNLKTIERRSKQRQHWPKNVSANLKQSDLRYGIYKKMSPTTNGTCFMIFALIITVVCVIQAEEAPRITIQPNDLIAIEGEATELNCDAEGDPEPAIEWFHNGQLIRQSSKTRTTMGGSIQFLDVRPASSSLRASDVGVYHCVAKNALGEARSRNASLQVACK